MSRALVLSGSIGLGHDVVGQACLDALTGAGWEAEMVDSMAVMGRWEGFASGVVMRGLLAVPGLYDGFHFSRLRTGGRVASRLDRMATDRMLGPVGELLDRRPAELVLSVFATGGAVADRLKAQGRRLVSVVYCTDACPHSLWVHPGTDLFLVTSEMSAEFVRYHRPSARVEVLAPAARPDFYRPVDREAARRSLDLVSEAGVALLMAGAWGMAPLDRLADAVAARGLEVLAVAGTNRALERRIRRLAARRPGVHPFGFTDRIPELMAAADVVVTTSGDTCTEARIIGRPLVLLDTVPGHGRENLQLELSRGNATASAAEPEVVAEAVALAVARGRTQQRASGTPDPESWARSLLSALARAGAPTG